MKNERKIIVKKKFLPYKIDKNVWFQSIFTIQESINDHFIIIVAEI